MVWLSIPLGSLSCRGTPILQLGVVLKNYWVWPYNPHLHFLWYLCVLRLDWIIFADTTMRMGLEFCNMIFVVALLPSQKKKKKEYSKFYCPCECINWKVDLRTGWTTLWFNHAQISDYILQDSYLVSLAHRSFSSVYNELKAAEHKKCSWSK